ncbi:MAG: toxic anion resistance protein [Planctomycetota bacterium]|nr:toxic anion resistance protein [Planctomycetota bacterium]
MPNQDTPSTGAKADDGKALPESGAAPAIPSISVAPGQVATLPTLESLKGGSTVFRDLDPARQKLAIDIAAKTKFDDPLAVVDFGQQQALDASKVARTLADTTKTADTGQVGELAMQLKARYQELGVGGLRIGWFGKLVKGTPILGKLVDPLKEFIERQEKIGSKIDTIFEAQSREGLQLRELYHTLERIRDDNQAAYDNLGVAIGAAEKALERMEAEARQLAEKHRNTTDPAKIRELKNALQALVVLDHRILTLKTARFEALNSMAVMDLQLQALVALIGMVNSSASVMKQAWMNQISIAIANHRMSGAATMLRENRSFMNRIMSANAQQLGQVLGAIQTELGQGVVDVAVLEAVAQKTIQMQDEIISKTVEIRQRLTEQSKKVTDLEESVRKANQNSEAVVRAINARAE